MQKIDHMLSPPIVGQFYLVPGIQYRLRMRDGWYPILGTKHEDAEFINFPHQHYHPDWRFMPEWSWREMSRMNHGEQSAFGLPLYHLDDSYKEMPLPAPIYRRRICRRVPPENTIFAAMKGGGALHRAWAGKDARRGPHGLICPHRGTVLGSVPENADGTITCPLHGLKFCAHTGKSVPTQPAA